MKPSGKCLCFTFFSHLFVFLTLLMWNSTKRKAAVSLRIFWRPWQNGWASITVMRLQEWPPRFLHLRHLSLRLLQGIQSFLYNSLLSLLLFPLSFALWSHSLFIISEISKKCVHLYVCMRGEVYYVWSLRLMRNAGICSASSAYMHRPSVGRLK